ncbi:UDP-N-acetylglucosamine 2-epimerase [Candidatus Pelagibacter sp.]|nr:UDP-N-acetylglucosamine 2-epimerase [Candidatus Pelagibacter sp.]
MSIKKLIFVSATRADYGKQKNLIKIIQKNNKFKTYIFITGMHTLKKYGETWKELKKDNIKKLFIYKNQKNNSNLNDIFLSTYKLFIKFAKKIKPDLVLLHGDRIETLACATSSALNNYKIGHIEGGELSGTIDESIRHSVSKLANHHFVSNRLSQNRLIQMGESKKDISIIGSPDLDIALSKNLPSLTEVKQKYSINFNNFAIMIFHPVFSEITQIQSQITNIIDAMVRSNFNYVIILPNNDLGSNIIYKTIAKQKKNKNFRILKSIRFEYFIQLLKFSKFIIGNSSTGIIEAPHLNTYCINIGTRQKKRIKPNKFVSNVSYSKEKILKNIIKTLKKKKTNHKKYTYFGNGQSANLFLKKLNDNSIWKKSNQKYFIDFINK